MIRSSLSVIALAAAAILLAGCGDKGDGRDGRSIFSGISQAGASPEGAIIKDAVGRALIDDSGKPNDRIRAAAILDALRNLALQLQLEEGSRPATDTIIAFRNWGAAEALGVTIRRNGVTLLDSVALTVFEIRGEKQSWRRWKSFNMKLIEPGGDADARLGELIEALNVRGVQAAGGKPAERGVWQETLQLRKWEKR